MIGGEADGRRAARPDLRHARAGRRSGAAHAGPRRAKRTAERGYLHCGPHGAGHFVKMVHNGIEYGLMAAYAEGLNILRNANVGTRHARESTPRRRRCAIRSTTSTSSTSPQITEVWRHGSVDQLVAAGSHGGSTRGRPELASFAGRVSDSGEGRWTIAAAIDEGVPAPVLSAALYQRFSSRGERRVCRSGVVGDAPRVRRPSGKSRSRPG